MYSSFDFKQENEETFSIDITNKKNYKIMQLTDMHFGFGFLSRKKDQKAMDDIKKLILMDRPDLIVITGDMIFPFLPKTGTKNNRKQCLKFMEFMDGFEIPYALVIGNHDTEMFSTCNRQELGQLLTTGKYSVFLEGPKNVFGVGNYCINLMKNNIPIVSLMMLDSNMYGDGWFYSGFDKIHSDQTDWCMNKLNEIKKQNNNLYSMAFFHMPLWEFKEAYEKRLLGDESVKYNFGYIGEKNNYFGISKERGDLFEKAKKNGVIKAMFFGHDHLNTLSLTYEGIQMTYGMSIDYLGYKGIDEFYTQRGATVIEIREDTSFRIYPLPVDKVVSKRIRGLG